MLQVRDKMFTRNEKSHLTTAVFMQLTEKAERIKTTIKRILAICSEAYMNFFAIKTLK